MIKGRQLLLDPTAQSAVPGEPAFIARPLGSPVYHGFVVIPETHIGGWVLGEITEYIGADEGDGFVIAPDGARAGLVWAVGDGQMEEILGPGPTRSGVYAVWFPREMHKMEDIISNFCSILPALKERHAELYPPAV